MLSADPLLLNEKRKLTRLRSDLLRWAKREGRDLPWRRPEAKPYEQVVVEVLLQRTTAAAVVRFYYSFFERFPEWESLASAEVEELEEFIRPLGLWRRRATALLGLARYAVAAGANFPKNQREHASIPAVGQYVSNAIAMFYHDQPRPLIDVNMARVIERLVRPRRLADIRHDPWLQEAAQWLVACNDARAVNWAVLDFAALVCKARDPLCGSCPVRTRCAYFRRVTSLPSS